MKRAKGIDPANEKMTMDVAAAAAATDMSISFYRKAIRAGAIKVTRLGRRVLIRREELNRFLDANTAR